MRSQQCTKHLAGAASGDGDEEATPGPMKKLKSTTTEPIAAAPTESGSPRSKGAFRLLDLPRELRDMIYDETIFKHRHTCSTAWAEKHPGRVEKQVRQSCRSLRGVCQQIYHETSGLYSRTAFTMQLIFKDFGQPYNGYNEETLQKIEVLILETHMDGVFYNHRLILKGLTDFGIRMQSMKSLKRVLLNISSVGDCYQSGSNLLLMDIVDLAVALANMTKAAVKIQTDSRPWKIPPRLANAGARSIRLCRAIFDRREHNLAERNTSAFSSGEELHISEEDIDEIWNLMAGF